MVGNSKNPSMKTLYVNVLCCFLFITSFQAKAQSLQNANTTSSIYSSKLLSNNYAGFCYRVRRAADNAEAWIDFDATTQSVTPNSNAIIILPGSSNLVPGTVMSFSKFYATTSCFVTTWFDQSGNGYDAIQPSIAAQPRIVNAGTIETLPYTSSNFTQPKTIWLAVDDLNTTSKAEKNKGR